MDIRLNNLTITYDRHPAVHHLNASVPTGSLLAIVGPNGAGKSTLLNTLAGLTAISGGSIDGVRADEIAYLPQQAQLDKHFPLSVAELVATGLWRKISIGKSLTSKLQQQCEDAIAAVGLLGFEHRMINTLSGGQLQRALFARVLLQDSRVILLDEPFNAIDAKTVADLTRVIKNWHAAERTVAVVMHDLEHVRQHFPLTLLLARECVDYGATSSVLTAENLLRAKHMCEAFDDQASWCEQSAA